MKTIFLKLTPQQKRQLTMYLKRMGYEKYSGKDFSLIAEPINYAGFFKVYILPPEQASKIVKYWKKLLKKV